MSEDTKLDLAAIKAKCAAATPGPWKASGGRGAASVRSEWANCAIYINVRQNGETPECVNRWHRDAEFIAAARSDVPALVAEVERLRENSPLLARVQPCGCIVCYCEGQERCLGCGAKNCSKHVGNGVAMDPAAVWVKHPLLVEVDRLTKMLADQRCAYKTRAETAEAEVARLRSDLAECYRITGADPDGDDDAMLARKAVAAVKRLREESDTEAETADKRIAELEAAVSDAMVVIADMAPGETVLIDRLRSLLAKGGAA